MLKNGYKLIVIKDGHFDLKQFNITPLHILFFASLIVILTSSLFVVFSDEFVDWVGSREIQKHRNNNEKLIDQINENQQRLESLVNELDKIKEEDNNLRKLVKLPIIHEDVRKVGVGGASNKDQSENLEYLLPNDLVDLKQINKQINFVNRLVNLETLSFSEISKKVELDLDKIKAFPAIHPIPLENKKLSSTFGHRRDPFSREYKFHDGHDFSARTGTPVYATAAGRVKTSKYYGTFGNYIEVDHGNGYVSIYGHLSRRKVNRGEKVVRGQKIGTVGNTGRSTAPHLHYEVQYNKKSQDPSQFYFDTFVQ